MTKNDEPSVPIVKETDFPPAFVAVSAGGSRPVVRMTHNDDDDDDIKT